MLLSLLLAACTPASSTSQTPSGTAPVEMRVYAMSGNQAGYAKQAINTVLAESGSAGSAELGPNGALVVVAPAPMLDGVQGMVEQLEAAGTEGRPPRNITVHYWFVRGTPQADVSVSPALKEVASVFETIAAADGAQRFELDTSRSLRTVEGRDGAMQEDDLQIKQEIALNADGQRIQADIEVFKDGMGRIRTEVALVPGKHAVIAHSGAEGDHGYVIVRPEVR